MTIQFRDLTARAVVLLLDHIDTDQIIPARFLKTVNKQDLGKQLFNDWRKNDPDFALDRPEHEGAQILIAGENFGCGSSREHAPWALLAGGLRVVIARSFADIFRQNAIKNGLLPVALESGAHQRLLGLLDESGKTELTVDLEAQKVTVGSEPPFAFSIDEFSRYCLLEGVDQLDYLRSFEKEISAYEQRHDKNG
jgi:3-isopropylmalate/(R)-2-methylmalate dehydratase small subunit